MLRMHLLEEASSHKAFTIQEVHLQNFSILGVKLMLKYELTTNSRGIKLLEDKI